MAYLEIKERLEEDVKNSLYPILNRYMDKFGEHKIQALLEIAVKETIKKYLERR